ncbi:MAG: DUF2887 domain-containing protein [Gloeocapsa sp. DLM2.Bin57]|nr:MAG: DUF2887 domain-containing protein [Gloeocapsa sp. DLM2.Bin57]
MKTDTIFYRLFQTYPPFLFQLINSPTEVAHLYQFSSVEVKQIAFRIDGVFLPSQPDLPIYFLEVQFFQDSDILLHRIKDYAVGFLSFTFRDD